MINLQIYPQTALLFLIDALNSTGKIHKLELYLESGKIGGAIWELEDLSQPVGKLLFAENELQQLMAKFMAFLQAADKQAEPEAHPADSTGASEP